MITSLRKLQTGTTTAKAAASSPGVNDDISLGYGVGSLWFNTVTKVLYSCSNAADGAAVWDAVIDTNALVALAKGQRTTVGGAATEAFTISGITSGNKCFLQLVNDGTNNVAILSANVTGANTLTVVFSGDPAADTVFNYLVVA